MRVSTLVAKSALLTALCLASGVLPSGASADSTLTTLHSFTGYPGDGAYPYAGVIYNPFADQSGSLYGTTLYGGAYGYGAVFKLSPRLGGAWSESVLYSFTGYPGDGASPTAGLIADQSGALYGTTLYGGAYNYGAVFKLTPPAQSGGAWSESVLYSFTGYPGDGASPYAGVIFGGSGAVYGTTYVGGAVGAGTVFKLTPPAQSGGVWSESVLHSFTGPPDGGYPFAGVIFGGSGALYGTTSEGGAAGAGTVFKLTPPARSGGAWSESVLYSFTGAADGGYPIGGVILDVFGALYGTTEDGGAYDYGTVFKLTPPPPRITWGESVLHSFTGAADGGSPEAGVIFDQLGALYGTTIEGGAGCAPYGCGAVFKLTPPARSGGAWGESVLHRFTGSLGDGALPLAGVIFDQSGALYGTTYEGGADGYGTVFKLTP